MTTGFKRATRTTKKLRAALLGPAGAGKTRTALEIARGLGERIALIDTEHGSASMYAHLVPFDCLELTHYAPDRYIEAIGQAEDAGYDVLVIDSLSHAWSGKGGILEFVDRTKRNGNSFNAWGDATPMHNKLVERLLSCRMHLLVTMRTKMEFVQEKDQASGKTIVRKVGMQPVQRDGMEYEFDLICDIDQGHTLTVGKTRIDLLDGEMIERAGADFGRRIRAWLEGGSPAPAPAPAAQVVEGHTGKWARVGEEYVPTEKLSPATLKELQALALAELDRLKIGDGMTGADLKAARNAAVRRIAGRAPRTAEEWQAVVEALEAEPTPATIDGADAAQDSAA